jgi:hypothetical protein
MVASMLAIANKLPAPNAAFIFPALMLTLNFGAAVVSLARGDWNRGVYWLASGTCVAAVTFR